MEEARERRQENREKMKQKKFDKKVKGGYYFPYMSQPSVLSDPY